MQLCEFRCSMPCNIAFEELFRNVHPNETSVQFPAFCILMEDLHFLFGVVQPISPHSFPSQLRFKAQLIQSLRWLSEPAGLELVRETFRSQPVQAMSILANSLAPYYHKWSGSSLYSLVCRKSVQRYQTLNEKTVTKLFTCYVILSRFVFAHFSRPKLHFSAATLHKQPRKHWHLDVSS